MNARLSAFVVALERAVNIGGDEPALIESVVFAMVGLVAVDDWLPPEMAQPDPLFYRQYLLYSDPRQRFSVVSFVWGPGQFTPIHDHMTWGVIGMLRGSECSQEYRVTAQGPVPQGAEHCLPTGSVLALSPRLGDIHRVRNAFEDRVSISIHAYGTDIGRQRRHVFDPVTGGAREFVSGYSNPLAPKWANPSSPSSRAPE
jgi:predicted metal-dependent enzyme (double-stranded beta helix superfamily)